MLFVPDMIPVLSFPREQKMDTGKLSGDFSKLKIYLNISKIIIISDVNNIVL